MGRRFVSFSFIFFLFATCHVTSTFAIRANNDQPTLNTALVSEQESALSGEAMREMELAESLLNSQPEPENKEAVDISLVQVASGPFAPPSTDEVSARSVISQATQAAAQSAATAIAAKVAPVAATAIAKAAAEKAAVVSGTAVAQELATNQAQFHTGQLNTYLQQYNNFMATKQAEAATLGTKIAEGTVPTLAKAEADRLAPQRSQEIFDRKHPQITENARTAAVQATLNLYKSVSDADTAKHEEFMKQESQTATDLGKLYAQRASEHSLSQLKQDTVRVATQEGEQVGATAILPYVSSLNGYADVLANHAGDVAKTIANKAADELQTRVKADLTDAKASSLKTAAAQAQKLATDSLTQVVKQAQVQFIKAADASGKENIVAATDAATETAIQQRVPDMTKNLMTYVDTKLAADFQGRKDMVTHQQEADFHAADEEAKLVARQVAQAAAQQNAPVAASDAARNYLAQALEVLKTQAKTTATEVAEDAKKHIIDTTQTSMNQLNDAVNEAAFEAAKKAAFDETVRATNNIAEAQFRTVASDISNSISNQTTAAFSQLAQTRDQAFEKANAEESAMVKQEASRVAGEVARSNQVKQAIDDTVTATANPIIDTVHQQQLSDAQQKIDQVVQDNVAASLKPIADSLNDAMLRAQTNAEQAANTLAVDAAETAAEATATTVAKDAVKRLLHYLLARRSKDSIATQAVDDATKAGQAAATATATDIIITGASKKAIDDKVRSIAQNAASQQAQKLKQEAEQTRYVLQDVADDVQEEDAVTRSLLEQIERRLAIAATDPNYNATVAAQMAQAKTPQFLQVTDNAIASAVKEANNTATALASSVTSRYVDRLYNLIKNVYSRKYQAKMDQANELLDTDKKIQKRLTDSADNFFQMSQTDNNYFRQDVISEFVQLKDQQDNELQKATAYVNNAKVFSTLKDTMSNLAKAYMPDQTFSESQDSKPAPTLDHEHYDDAPLPNQAPSQQQTPPVTSFISMNEKIGASRQSLEQLTSSVDHLLLEANAKIVAEADVASESEDGVDMDSVNDIIEKVHSHYYDSSAAHKAKSVTAEEYDLASVPAPDTNQEHNDITGDAPNWLLENYFVPDMKD